MSSSATSIVIDTDIGTDADDALALASPEADLVGVTVVDGDVGLRARVAARLLGMAGQADVPVFEGHGEPMGPGRGPTMLGHEGRGILDFPYDGPEADVSKTGAAEWLIEESERRPYHLVAIGPLTNVGRALELDPGLAGRLLGLTVMGGVLDEQRLPAPWLGALRGAGLPPAWVDHNTQSDTAAAMICARSGAPLTWVTADVTFRAPLSRRSKGRLSAAGGALGGALARTLDAWEPALREPLPGHVGLSPVPKDAVAYLHDPLAVYAAFATGSDSLLRLREVGLDYEVADGLFLLREVGGTGGSAAHVSVGVGDFETLWLGRVERLLRHAAGK